MTTYYWVGGATNSPWSTGNTAPWATSSGGAGSAGVPTAADDVIFDNNSNVAGGGASFALSISNGALGKNVTVSAPGTGNTVTFNGLTSVLNLAGSFTLNSGSAVWSHTGTINFNSTTTGNTITTNGISLSCSVTFNGVGGGWTLGSALTCAATTLTAGSFNSGSFNITGSTLATTGSVARTLTLGTSTVTLSGASAWTTTGTNLTLSITSSTVNCSNATVTFAGGSFGQSTVNFTDTTADTHAITGLNTFVALSITPPTLGVRAVTFAGAQTITTLTASGTSSTQRVQLLSSAQGTSRTLTVATLTSLSDIDFRDITGAGAASWASGTRLGDCKGNSGITFSAAKTVYWNLAGAQNWSATGWATSSGGSPAAANFPLAQDTAVFDDIGSVTGTITLSAAWNIGTIDMSARTSAMTLSASAIPTMYGNWTNGSGSSITGSSAITYSGRTTQTITSAGKTFTPAITINAFGGTVTLADAFNTSGIFTLTLGTFTTGSFNVTSSTYSGSNSNTRALNLGSSLWTITGSGASAWLATTATNFTLNAGTSTILFTSSIAKSMFCGITPVYWNVSQGGSGALSLASGPQFNDIQNAYASTGATSILLNAAGSPGTSVTTFTASGSAGKLLSLLSNASPTQRNITITSGTVSVDYLIIKDIAAVGGTWYAGANSTDNGNNAGWIFTAPPTPGTNTSNFFFMFR